MRTLVTTALIATSFAIAVPASANGYKKFESTVTAPIQQSIKVEVVLSEDMANRAENLPEDISQRNGSRGLNAGFSNNGIYGQRDLTELTEYFEEKIEDRLEREGIRVDENASTTFRVTIEDAKNNRPTFAQMSHQPSLSFQSFGTGGAEVTGELISAGGTSLGMMSYSWYESNIREASYTAGTWTDAHRTFRRFAKKAANALSEGVR